MASLKVTEVTTPIQDSEQIRKAFQGFGMDEETVILVLGHRNANQRKKIRETYQQLYNESLIDRLHSELSRDFRLLVGLVSSYRHDKEVVETETTILEAKRLHEAINKKQLDHDDIIWILSIKNVFQLRATFACYKLLYENALEKVPEEYLSSYNLSRRKLFLVIVSSIGALTWAFLVIVSDNSSVFPPFPMEDEIWGGNGGGQFIISLILQIMLVRTSRHLTLRETVEALFSRREVDEVKELVIIVKKYVLGLQMEFKRREMKDNPVRQQELAAYFTHCNLQMPHLRLALLNAMTVCYKACIIFHSLASNFARRLLETNPTIENQAKIARQVEDSLWHFQL